MSAEEHTMEDAPRVAVVTGASSGIGAAAAAELARRGWAVALVGRDPDRLATALSRVRAAAPDPATATAHQCDFAVLDDVRSLAGKLRAAYPKIDLLANNAGGAFPRRVTTVDGHELTMQVNYLAPFLLTTLLSDLLAGGRIINTSSAVHTSGRLDPDDLASERRPFRMMPVYGTSKQANILFTVAATRRWPDITSVAFHPGVVRTNFGNASPTMAFFYRYGFFLATPAKGADTLVWLAEQPTVIPGGYYANRRARQPAAAAIDPDLAERLWLASEAAVAG
jgi:NAD(P)-dependent dehydrogenase (short-subunit alcohol dehydrogenase family)